MKSNVDAILEKSIACTVSAIEIYNKPDFKYREETFSILMINAWELLLKAKKIKDAHNNIRVIYAKENIPKKHGGKSKRWKYKMNKKGYYITQGIEKLLMDFSNDSNIDKRCLENIELLNNIRNSAIHLINKDSELCNIVFEIGSANLKNYIEFIVENFNKDLSKYNFYLMPLSFYNDYEIVDNLKIQDTSLKTKLKKDLLILNTQYKSGPDEKYSILLSTKVSFTQGDAKIITTRFGKAKEDSDFTINLSDDEIDRRYPLSFEDLIRNLRKKYPNFKQDKYFYKLNETLRGKKINGYQRFLNNKTKSGTYRWQYSSNILNDFDKYYTK